jgi:beta-lactamase superfamily II metal-dependent hydrolase
MGYEIDFLPVGNGVKSGDAIAVRFGDLHSRRRRDQFVMVIDGGTKESGQKLVDHIREYYGTSYVDLVVNSHPDADHSSGLSVVLEELTVGRLWMHRPWMHSSRMPGMFRDGITTAGVSRKLKASLEDARELEGMARSQGIPIEEPFVGVSVGSMHGAVGVLGPTEEYYEGLLADFRDTPAKKEAVSTSYGRGGVGILMETLKAVASRIAESWGVETLVDPADEATSAENNSSAILLIELADRNLLFTADAGVPALERAAEYAEDLGIDLRQCPFSQVPHHGSNRNVGPSLLDRIIGPRLRNDVPAKTAFVSVSEEGEPKHPSRKVTNAYRRRGARIVATKGSIKRHSHDAPDRAGWVTVEPLPFYTQVEED